MKKIIFSICCLVAMLKAENFYNNKSLNVFENGFNAGLSAVKLQAKYDGLRPQILSVNKNFLLILKIDKIGLDEALFLQVIATREGFETHLTKDFITFGEYEREIDAKKTSKVIIDNFKLNPNSVKILSGVKQIKTYPYLFIDYFKQFEIQEKNIKKPNLEVVNNIEMKTQTKPQSQKIETKAQTKPQSQELENNETQALLPLKIIFKNKQAMSYKNIDDNESNSASFVENGFKTGEFLFDKIIFTNADESFVKVKDENLYFSNEDIN